MVPRFPARETLGESAVSYRVRISDGIHRAFPLAAIAWSKLVAIKFRIKY